MSEKINNSEEKTEEKYKRMKMYLCHKHLIKGNTYDFDYETNIATGYTSKGQPFYFDIEDYDKIKEYKWHISLDGYVISGTSKNNQKEIRMHRLIMDCPKGKVVDHIDHCKKNNCKSNLRICTHSENMKNKKKSKNNTSGITGVTWNKRDKKWQAQITVDKETIHLGYFKTLEEAAKARREAEIKYFGEFACTES